MSSLLTDMPIRITQGEVVEYDLFSYDATVDENGSEVAASRVRSDLTTAVITTTIERADGTDVFTKVSTDSAQIEINADQVDEITKGSAILKFLAADTSGLEPGTIYWHHTFCVYADGREARIIKRSRFYVDR